MSPAIQWLVLAALGCTGCGLIAGVEDGTLDPDAGTSAAQSSSGAGGACSCSYAAEVLTDQPIAYWRLGDAALSPTAKDEMGRHPGEYQPGASPGKPGALPCDDLAAEFVPNGSVAVGDAPDLDLTGDGGVGSESFALEAWIKFAPGANLGTVCGKLIYEVPDGGMEKRYMGYAMALNTNGHVAFVRGNEDEDGGVKTLNADIEPGQWVHVVAQYNGSEKFLHVNGATPATQGDDHPALDLDVDFMIGDSSWGNFEGSIDEVAVYRHTLEPERIKAHIEACPR